MLITEMLLEADEYARWWWGLVQDEVLEAARILASDSDRITKAEAEQALRESVDVWVWQNSDWVTGTDRDLVVERMWERTLDEAKALRGS